MLNKNDAPCGWSRLVTIQAQTNVYFTVSWLLGQIGQGS